MDFVKLVKKLRETQKKYFSTRDLNVLKEAKKLEKEVDQRIKEIEEAQLSLFNHEKHS